MDDQKLQQAWKNRQRRSRTRCVGELVPRVLEAVHRMSGERVAALEPVWARVLPEALAGRASLAGVDDGCVYLAVSDAVCRFEVQRVVAPRMLREVQAAFPRWGITYVKVALDPQFVKADWASQGESNAADEHGWQPSDR